MSICGFTFHRDTGLFCFTPRFVFWLTAPCDRHHFVFGHWCSRIEPSFGRGWASQPQRKHQIRRRNQKEKGRERDSRFFL